MKPVGLISAGVLLLILGAAAPTYARQDQHEGDDKAPKQEEAKPAKQQEQPKTTKQEEAKPEEAKPEEARAPRHQEQAKPEKQQDAKAPKQEEAKPVREQEAKAAPKHEQQAKVQQGQARNSREPQRSAAAEQKQRSEPALRLSARGDGRIPDDRFRASFGSEHTFRIGSPTLVGGYSRFQYGGFWFGFVQPWPVGWYYTDDVYVDYIDGGYYLCNPYYPDTRISISVVI